MSRPVLIVALLAALAPLARGEGPGDNVERLRGMTPDERRDLAKNLEAFDALDPARRDAIRAIDAKVQALDPEVRARYLAVLRRYHVLYAGLSEEQRKALDAKRDPAEKARLLASYRAARKPSPAESDRFADALQISALSPARLRPTVRELMVYFSLDPVKDKKERAALYAAKKEAVRRPMVREIVKAKDLRGKLRDEGEEYRDAAQSVERDAILRGLVDRAAEQEKSNAPRRKGAAPLKAGEIRNQLLAKVDERQVLRHYGQEKVDPANLERFEAALPPWAREPLDMLPPEAAVRRLRVMYRLIFPAPQEMPASLAAPESAPQPKGGRAPGGGENVF